MAIRMYFWPRDPSPCLHFPDFEDGSKLAQLVDQLAIALGTTVRRTIGNPLEQLVFFNGYPHAFGLYWDAFSCTLGCSEPCGIDMDDISRRLIEAGGFSLEDRT